MNESWKLVAHYPVTRYRCGARAGDRVRLRSDIVIRHHNNSPTGDVHAAGEIWTVLSGDLEEPPVVWLLRTNGERCTWSDDEDFLRTFEILDNSD
jgi:hypothetical protein